MERSIRQFTNFRRTWLSTASLMFSRALIMSSATLILFCDTKPPSCNCCPDTDAAGFKWWQGLVKRDEFLLRVILASSKRFCATFPFSTALVTSTKNRWFSVPSEIHGTYHADGRLGPWRRYQNLLGKPWSWIQHFFLTALKTRHMLQWSPWMPGKIAELGFLS